MLYDAVVFDADGVLCKPTALSTLRTAIRRALAEHGVDDPPTDALDRLFGVTADSLRELCESLEVEDVAEFWRTRDRHASTAQRDAIRRGEKALYDDVAGLSSLSVPLAVVSNNQQETVSFLLEHAGLTDQFDPVFGRAPTLEDVARKKPAPHYLERAVEALGADRPLFVGDSNVDLGAAAAAGVDSAFIRREHRADYVLEHEPDHELETLEELGALVGAGEADATDTAAASDD